MADFKPSVVYKWIDTLLDVTKQDVSRSLARPTIISRNVFITIAAMYQSWAAYDSKAIGAIPGSFDRRPQNEHSDENRTIAISYAAFRAMLNVYPKDKSRLIRAMQDLSLDPDDSTTDPATPHGVGNLSAEAVIAARRKDGSNQYGDYPNSTEEYSDYTGYQPINTPQKIVDPNRWQPIEFTMPDGSKKTLPYLTPHWGLVKPFGLKSSDQFRPGSPPKVGSEDLARDVREVLFENAYLTVEKKAIVEYMRDGPGSTSHSGQWLGLAQYVSQRDRHSIESDIKMFFALAITGLDAFIASWEAKRFYDSSRPWTLVRHYCAGSEVLGWGGPGMGVITLPASEWHPYAPSNFITPPFPGYVSGHSTVSGASARILEAFTGSDAFGYAVDWQTGSLTEDGFPCSFIQKVEGESVHSPVLNCYVNLRFPTFSSVAEAAGISRIYGGFHVQIDNIEGLILGRKIAAHNWEVAKSLYAGNSAVLSA